MNKGDLLDALHDLLDRFEDQPPTPETAHALYNELYFIIQEFDDEED